MPHATAIDIINVQRKEPLTVRTLFNSKAGISARPT